MPKGLQKGNKFEQNVTVVETVVFLEIHWVFFVVLWLSVIMCHFCLIFFLKFYVLRKVL